MSENTKIEWASHTFNPWIGCAKVRCGCDNCYAETMAGRLGVTWGPYGTRRRTAELAWRQVERWNRMAAHAAEQQLQFIRPKCRDGIPVARPRVFQSLCDPFEDWRGPILDADGSTLYVCTTGQYAGNIGDFPSGRLATMDDVRRDLFALIDRCPNMDFLLCTKRPQNVRRMWRVDGNGRDPGDADYLRRDNAWLLYSASDQQSLESGLPHLLACRDLVPVLGLSLEPLVGPVDLGLMVGPAYGQRSGQPRRVKPDWVIVGGESGPRARPCDVAWIRSVVRQCRDAGVKVFVKQLGANIECIDVIDAADHFPVAVRLSEAKRPNARVHLRDPKGGDITEFPSDLQIMEFPLEVCK